MANGEKVQLYKDRAKTIPVSYKTKAEYVILSDGNNLEEVLREDVATQTVVHNDVNFNVGVGDSDVSNSVVDGEISKMIIKGQTYQNILPDPSLRNSMSNGKTMQKINEGYDSVNVIDGVGKSAILKGQTLVNTITNVEGQYSWTTVDNITFTHNKDSGGFSFINYNCSLKPNTKYFIRFEYDYAGNENLTLQFGFRTNLGAWDSYGTTLTKGVNKATLTTNGTSNNLSVIIMSGQTLESASFGKLMVIEYQDGMENWDIPYFEGMQSVKMPVLKATGKNLFDGELQLGAISDGNNVSWREYFRSKNFIPIKPSTIYGLPRRILVDNTWYDGSYELNFYDDNKQYIGKIFGKTCTTPSNAKFMRICYFVKQNFTVTLDMLKETQIYFYEDGTINDEFEPYKSNILHTPEEVVLRSLPNGVKDTLNLMTGEYVQRIGEITFQNQTGWQIAADYPNLFYYNSDNIGNANIFVDSGVTPNLQCDKLPVVSYAAAQQSTSGIKVTNRGKLGTHSIAIYNSNTSNVDELKAWLRENPITIQYELATPIIKTVDLSSYGNWNKVTLNGSENGWGVSLTSWQNKVFCLTNAYLPNVIIPTEVSTTYVMCDKLKGCSIDWLCGKLGRTGVALHHWYEDYLQIAIDGVNTLDELKQYLSENPITVWYPTKTQQENSITEMLSFNDGHIQLSSEEGSLIPSLDYEVPTSNSYHMDLMKTNTRYNMRCSKHNNAQFIFNGVQGVVGSNILFDSPSIIDSNLMTTTATVEDFMLIEGNHTAKSIPYFKGIKSAFEDESKIEVLSTGKNLYDGSFRKGNIDSQGNAVYNESSKNVLSDFILAKPNMTYTMSNHGVANKTIFYCQYDSNKQYVGAKAGWETKTLDSNVHYIRIQLNETTKTIEELNNEFMLEESSTATQYETYKSNSTKIPLLQGLKSTQTGDVYDEVIVERHNNVATITKRINDDLSIMSTPITTKVDMSGFPYVYKDGHIFLNSEVEPEVRLTYNTCQSHQIQANNESLQRQEKEISELDKYIAYFIESDYRLKLLKFDMEMTSIMREE